MQGATCRHLSGRDNLMGWRQRQRTCLHAGPATMRLSQQLAGTLTKHHHISACQHLAAVQLQMEQPGPAATPQLPPHLVCSSLCIHRGLLGPQCVRLSLARRLALSHLHVVHIIIHMSFRLGQCILGQCVRRCPTVRVTRVPPTRASPLLACRSAMCCAAGAPANHSTGAFHRFTSLQLALGVMAVTFTGGCCQKGEQGAAAPASNHRRTTLHGQHAAQVYHTCITSAHQSIACQLLAAACTVCTHPLSRSPVRSMSPPAPASPPASSPSQPPASLPAWPQTRPGSAASQKVPIDAASFISIIVQQAKKCHWTQYHCTMALLHVERGEVLRRGWEWIRGGNAIQAHAIPANIRKACITQSTELTYHNVRTCAAAAVAASRAAASARLASIAVPPARSNAARCRAARAATSARRAASRLSSSCRAVRLGAVRWRGFRLCSGLCNEWQAA